MLSPAPLSFSFLKAGVLDKEWALATRPAEVWCIVENQDYDGFGLLSSVLRQGCCFNLPSQSFLQQWLYWLRTAVSVRPLCMKSPASVSGVRIVLCANTAILIFYLSKSKSKAIPKKSLSFKRHFLIRYVLKKPSSNVTEVTVLYLQSSDVKGTWVKCKFTCWTEIEKSYYIKDW